MDINIVLALGVGCFGTSLAHGWFLFLFFLFFHDDGAFVLFLYIFHKTLQLIGRVALCRSEAAASFFLSIFAQWRTNKANAAI